MPTSHDIRSVLLDVIQEQDPQRPTDARLNQNSVLNETKRRMGVTNDEIERVILTVWHELFRTGYLAWGSNINNPDAPFFHVTEIGRRTLESLSRDPANPGGYLAHLYSIATLQPLAKSYLEEGLACFVAGLYKAAAVMIGVSSESLILELRDLVVEKITTLGGSVPRKLKDWKSKTILDGTHAFFDGYKTSFQRQLREEFEAYWSAFTLQIRAARNDAGHPSSVDPVTHETVHASLLIFPELARLSTQLQTWVIDELNIL